MSQITDKSCPNILYRIACGIIRNLLALPVIPAAGHHTVMFAYGNTLAFLQVDGTGLGQDRRIIIRRSNADSEEH